MHWWPFFVGVFLIALPAYAEDIASAPGWSMARISEQTQEDNVYADTRVYFSLKPPDARPAISIDANTADRLRAGDANAEAIYTGNQSAAKSDEEFVYGNHGNGIQMADAVNSTLTGEEGRKDVPLASTAPARSLANGGGGLAGFNGGISSDPGGATAAKVASMQNGAGARAASTKGASMNPKPR